MRSVLGRRYSHPPVANFTQEEQEMRNHLKRAIRQYSDRLQLNELASDLLFRAMVATYDEGIKASHVFNAACIPTLEKYSEN